MPMVKKDSSIRSGKPGRGRMHPAGNVETKNRSSGLLDSKRTPNPRVGSIGKGSARTLESRGGTKL